MSSDQEWMQQALALAQQGQYATRPNPAVGCVIVNDGKIVGSGWHQRAGEAHAEILALQAAGEQAEGATAYVTLEPCSHQGKTGPCCQALIDAKVAQVVVAILDPNPKVNGRGIRALRDAGITVDVGLCEDEAEALNAGFCYAMRTGQPYVRCKLAMSLDGRTAMSSGESQWITGPEARQDVQYLRARSGAIITGIGTVLADDPALTVRTDEWPEPVEYRVPAPIRVVLDRQGRFPMTSKLLDTLEQAPLWVAFQDMDPDKQAQLAAMGVNMVQIDNLTWPTPNVLAPILQRLMQAQVYDVLIESGATLAGEALQQDVINELWIYMAPKLMGHEAQPLMQLPGIKSMSEAKSLRCVDAKSVGQDWRFVYQVQSG